MRHKIRMWLIKKLVGKRPMAMNLHLMRGLYFYASSCGFYNNIRVDYYDGDLPEKVGFYIHTPAEEAVFFVDPSSGNE